MLERLGTEFSIPVLHTEMPSKPQFSVPLSILERAPARQDLTTPQQTLLPSFHSGKGARGIGHHDATTNSLPPFHSGKSASATGSHDTTTNSLPPFHSGKSASAIGSHDATTNSLPPFHSGKSASAIGSHDATTNSLPPFHSGKGARGIGHHDATTFLFPFPILGKGLGVRATRNDARTTIRKETGILRSALNDTKSEQAGC